MKLLAAPWPRFAFAALAGGVWAASFPLPGIAGLGWLAPGLLLASALGADRGPAFRAAYVAGFVHFIVSLAWLRHIPFPAGAYAAWICLSLFLALFPAFWVLGSWRLALSLGVVPAGPVPSFSGLGQRLAEVPWWKLSVWFLACGAAWVTWEMIVARLFGGFPWNLLGASQYRMLPLIQISAATGVYGVSFLMVWFSASFFTAIVLLVRHPDRPAVWRRPFIFPSLILVATAGSGFFTLMSQGRPTRELAVAMVQPSIPQTVIFDPDASTNRFETLLRLTEQALATRPELLLWPEASLPGGLSPENFDELAAKVRGAGAWFIFGSDELDETTPSQPRAYNAAFLMNPQGEVVDTYRKQRLVMFGEYIPLVRWLPFLRVLSPIGDGFSAGTAPREFRMSGLDVTTSVLICFEDNFPHLARKHAGPGVDFLVNLTNNGWFGESAAQWQHAANSVFRAIENGLPLVRCTNNGLTCWIDAQGRLHSVRIAEGRNVYEAGFDAVTVRFGVPGGRTLYNRFGDVFGWLCVAATVAELARDRFRRRTPRA